MDKTITEVSIGSHELKMVDRSQIIFTGIKKITSFDNEEFLMDSTMGVILLKGESLEIVKLDTHEGNVKIKGKVNSIAYLENNKLKNKEEGFIAKLFK
ncbi:MAG: sporulation protein YabP [Bacilli bacterium]|nr:sporulation protein YabP [Bacilli bacterium]